MPLTLLLSAHLKTIALVDFLPSLFQAPFFPKWPRTKIRRNPPLVRLCANGRATNSLRRRWNRRPCRPRIRL